jgi:hypothetical protein
MDQKMGVNTDSNALKTLTTLLLLVPNIHYSIHGYCVILINLLLSGKILRGKRTTAWVVADKKYSIKDMLEAVDNKLATYDDFLVRVWNRTP